jgi:hypothetical protein
LWVIEVIAPFGGAEAMVAGSEGEGVSAAGGEVSGGGDKGAGGEGDSVTPGVRFRSCNIFMLAALAVATLSPVHAARPYEAQIGGFMTAALQTLITGEFAGRSPSNADAALDRPICRPSDYDDLRAAANDRDAFDAFRRRCKLVEGKIDGTHVHSTAYLPRGYCEGLKAAFEKALAERVYAEQASPTPDLIIEYKGSRLRTTRRQLARGAGMDVTCQDDGALRVSAPRRRP